MLANFRTKKIRYDFVIAIIILIAPYSIFLHLLFDSQSKVISFFGFDYVHSWYDNASLIWIIAHYLNPILLISLFYLNSKGIYRLLLLLLIVFEFNGLVYMFSNARNFSEAFLVKEGLFISLLFLILLHCSYLYYTMKYSSVLVNWKFREILLFSANRSFISLKRKVEQTIQNKKSYSFKKYTYQLFHLSELLQKSINRSTPKKELIHLKEKPSRIEEIRAISILILILIGSRIYSIVPNDMQSIEIFGYTIGNFGFNNTSDLVWYTSRKGAFIVLLAFWFNQCRHWWRWTILSPISLYIYQLQEAFIVKESVEEYSNLILLPLVFLSLIGAIGFIQLLKKSNKANKLMEDVSKEIEISIEEMCHKN